ncbi:MAG TPA: peptidyl-prolyl cis-trans isomerase [Pyrinomonadaceae bacterium]|nr:peptidyl-prolyl cis-trans isomerase [Pyrinomonadaceae bacterium]
MLKQLGRLERTRNIVILGFAILMAVSLVFFYAPGRSASNLDPTKNTEVVAQVGSDTVTVAELARARENMMQRYGGQINLAMLGGSRRFLDGLVNQRVMVQEAERLGLGASDAELKERLMKQFSDASGQFVGYERYKESVTPRYGDIETYEKEVRDGIAIQKLQAFVTASINVSDDEVREEYKRRNTSFDVNYISLTADKLAAKIQPSDDELRSYFESHKTDYRFLEPQKRVRYLFINIAKAGSKIEISDEDLKARYEQVKPEFKDNGIKIQQIMLKVARKDLDAQVEQKAKELIAKITNGTRQATEEAFGEAAKGNSEDPATARNNGFLSAPFKDNPNKPHGLYSRAVTMQVGEVSDIPIRYAGNWYILRRGDTVPKTFEQAKSELLVSARNDRGYNAAFEIAKKAKARLQETKDPQKVAQEFAAEANMNPADMVRETPYVKKGDDVANIGVNQQFEQALASLSNPNDVAEPVGVKDGFAIPMLIDQKEPRIPEFDEVKEKIANDIKNQRAKEQIDQKAKDLLASFSNVDAVKTTGEKEGFDSGYEEGFKLSSTLGKAGSSIALDDAIYSLKEGEISKTPIKVQDKWVIVGIVKRIEPDFTAFNGGERDRLKEQLLGARQTQVFQDYIAGVQQRMKQNGKIKIYDNVLKQLDESEPAAEPALPAGLNFPTK